MGEIVSNIICIAGPENGGKSTIAEILTKHLKNYHCCAFADEIKSTICRIFGVDRQFIEHWKRIDQPPPGFSISMRELMKFIGEEFRRIKPGCWSDFLLSNHNSKNLNLIISDARKCDEIENVKKYKSKVLLVWREECNLNPIGTSEIEVCNTVKKFLNFPIVGENKSEFLNSVDHFIINNKNKEELELEIIKLLPVLLG